MRFDVPFARFAHTTNDRSLAWLDPGHKDFGKLAILCRAHRFHVKSRQKPAAREHFVGGNAPPFDRGRPLRPFGQTRSRGWPEHRYGISERLLVVARRCHFFDPGCHNRDRLRFVDRLSARRQDQRARKRKRRKTIKKNGGTITLRGVHITPLLPLAKIAFRDCTLIHSDNLEALTHLRAEYHEKATLAYIDPPFFTNRAHETKPTLRRATVATTAFDDRWESQESYLEALRLRIVALRELVAPHGSVVVHVDPRTSHYVKVMCDAIFGRECFASEIIWRYRRWPSRTANFQRVHDVLLRYRKDARVAPRWNTLYEPLAASTLRQWGTKKQRAVFDGAGRRLRTSLTDEASAGVPMGDVWEIGVIAPLARERTGYPTQKPEALLERLMLSLSDPGDLVIDAYAGSGTTLAVAMRLGRHALGIDSSETAIATARERLKKITSTDQQGDERLPI